MKRPDKKKYNALELLKAAEALEKQMSAEPVVYLETKTLNRLNDLRIAIAKAKGEL